MYRTPGEKSPPPHPKKKPHTQNHGELQKWTQFPVKPIKDAQPGTFCWSHVLEGIWEMRVDPFQQPVDFCAVQYVYPLSSGLTCVGAVFSFGALFFTALSDPLRSKTTPRSEE